MTVAAVDSHLHVFATEAEGELAQGGTRLAGHAGTVPELEAVLDRGPIERALAYSTLPVTLWRRFLAPGWPADEVDDRLFAQAVAQNEWLCDDLAARSRLRPVVGADSSLDADRQRAHLAAMAAKGAVAIKIHPALNFVFPHDPGFEPVYAFAEEHNLPVVAHGGGSEGTMYAADVEYCAAREFAPVLRAHPRLRLVVAHFACPYHADLIAMAAEFENLHTDLSYVLGADLLPNDTLAESIRAFGVERVLFGSDFPYFDPVASLERLQTCGLSSGELEAVSRTNAEALFTLG